MLVGRHRKDAQVMLLKPKVEPMKLIVAKIIFIQWNYLISLLWSLNYAVVEQHYNFWGVLTYLWVIVRKLKDLANRYDFLLKVSMYKWFHLNGGLKDNNKQFVELNTYFVKLNWHCPIFMDHLYFKEEIYKELCKELCHNLCTQNIFNPKSRQSYLNNISNS